MHGRGAEFLEYGLGSIAAQTYPAIEVVVADHSEDDAIGRVCQEWQGRLDVRHIPNPVNRGSSSANLNVALRAAEGELIKILCQDDYLFDGAAIARTFEAFTEDAAWLVSSYLHTSDGSTIEGRQDPRLTAEIATVNTIGTHSCLTIRNEVPEMFDERLIWVMDCEYYRRLYDRFGPPVVLQEVTVVQTLWEGQVTNTHAADERLRRAEIRSVSERYPPIGGLPPSRSRLSSTLRRLRRS
jgi:glycosyltransferase involved in cell wall biosynthesis